MTNTEEIKDYWTEKMERMKKGEPCKHERTYVAVRHVSGSKLVKCSVCNCTVYNR